ncbi:MAG: hypoxanthine-guanine phosphoribosyltransferase [Gammaproteobacteria bacterium]|nr:hypoxanthine-guanine phosphoribosyltransferase [Gammaproteobacteria bacterium]
MQIKQALELHQQAQQLFDQPQVDEAIKTLADQLKPDLEEQFPLLLCVMNGGLYLTGQLMRLWNFPMTVDYVHATRYRLATLGRDVLWKAYPQNSLKDRHVIIVDDIFDQGFTLEEVKSYCLKQGAKKCTSVFLIRKTHNRKKADIEADFCALECDDFYVYGSGMDFHSHFRNLPGVFAVPHEKSGR